MRAKAQYTSNGLHSRDKRCQAHQVASLIQKQGARFRQPFQEISDCIDAIKKPVVTQYLTKTLL